MGREYWNSTPVAEVIVADAKVGERVVVTVVEPGTGAGVRVTNAVRVVSVPMDTCSPSNGDGGRVICQVVGAVPDQKMVACWVLKEVVEAVAELETTVIA